MTAPRRTPAQMAADALAATERRLEAVKARRARAAAEVGRANLEYDRLTALRDYQAAHPLLKGEEDE